MRVVFVLTYPIYHDYWTTDAWLKLINQNRWIPGVLAAMGHEVEYWAVDHAPSVHRSELEGFGDYTIRIFEANEVGQRTKFHYSTPLIEHARREPADLYLLKGVDGGIGTRLVRTFLKPEKRPFVFATGGKYYHPQVPDAAAVLYETAYQRRRLERPGLRFWRRAVPPERLHWLPKSVDTELFRPMPEVPKPYDVIAAARLVKRHKSFDELGRLSERCQVAVAGGGPEAEALRARYPRIQWLGQVPNREMPALLNQARLFLHPGARDFRPTRDFFPRVIAEAFACGLPCVGFDDLIMPDVIPPECGLRVSRSDTEGPVVSLLRDPERLAQMREAARRRAVEVLHKHSSRVPLAALIHRLEAAGLLP